VATEQRRQGFGHLGLASPAIALRSSGGFFASYSVAQPLNRLPRAAAAPSCCTAGAAVRAAVVATAGKAVRAALVTAGCVVEASEERVGQELARPRARRGVLLEAGAHEGAHVGRKRNAVRVHGRERGRVILLRVDQKRNKNEAGFVRGRRDERFFILR
jgi:hypothetical protein